MFVCKPSTGSVFRPFIRVTFPHGRSNPALINPLHHVGLGNNFEVQRSITSTPSYDLCIIGGSDRSPHSLDEIIGSHIIATNEVDGGPGFSHCHNRPLTCSNDDDSLQSLQVEQHTSEEIPQLDSEHRN